jgi:hypothetical protein
MYNIKTKTLLNLIPAAFFNTERRQIILGVRHHCKSGQVILTGDVTSRNRSRDDCFKCRSYEEAT